MSMAPGGWRSTGRPVESVLAAGDLAGPMRSGKPKLMHGSSRRCILPRHVTKIDELRTTCRSHTNASCVGAQRAYGAAVVCSPRRHTAAAAVRRAFYCICARRYFRRRAAAVPLRLVRHAAWRSWSQARAVLLCCAGLSYASGRHALPPCRENYAVPLAVRKMQRACARACGAVQLRMVMARW
jgi:hypothetical protein